MDADARRHRSRSVAQARAMGMAAVAVSVAVWFVLDTGLSLVLGFIGHGLFNVAFTAALAIPLTAIRAELD